MASSDATNIEASIRREHNEYVINAHKWFVSGTNTASLLFMYYSISCLSVCLSVYHCVCVTSCLVILHSDILVTETETHTEMIGFSKTDT